LSPERVTATPLAASSRFKPVEDASEISRVREKYGIVGDYILTVGSIQPRKNIPRLISAYAALCRERKVESIPKLVIVGKRAWLYEETLNAAENSAVRNQIIFTGYVPEEDLPCLYTEARCFIYPSYFEGFGIPPLEAMGCGTPTITANRTCFPEVIGDGGLMVDPFDIEAISAAMVRVLSDKQFREELRVKGLKRASVYDWRKTARLTLAIYEQVHAMKTNKSESRKRKAAHL